VALAISHDVEFYESQRFPAPAIAKFVREGLAADENVVVVTSLAHTLAIEHELGKAGSRTHERAKAFFVDTNTMSRALLLGQAVENVIERYLAPIVRHAREYSKNGRVRIYGELSDAMMRLYRPEIAIALEQQGAQMLMDGKTRIRCGYSENAFPDASFAKHFTRICLLHTHVRTDLKDRNDWRFKLAEGIEEARSGEI
jgi:hypothetical protein